MEAYDYVFALDGEWLSLIAGSVATFVVFVMGIPGLFSQTFIPDGLRSLHEERLDGKWLVQIRKQVYGILILLALASPIHKKLMNISGSMNWLVELSWAIIFFVLAGYLIIEGLKQFEHNFKNSQNIGEKLTRNIIQEAIKNYSAQKSINKKDIDDLGLLSKEIAQGAVKNSFIDECKKLIDFLLRENPDKYAINYVAEIIEKAICPCVNTDDTKANEENIRKALDALIDTYYKIQQISVGNDSRLHFRIIDSIREIGVKSIHRGDFTSFLDSTEKIVSGAKSHFVIKSEVLRDDIDALGLLVKDLPEGTTKNEFLEQCEVLIEYLLDVPGKKDYEAIGEIIEKVVYASVNTDDVEATEGNLRKALDIMSLAYNKMHINPVQNNPYLAFKIGSYIQEVGIKSILKGELLVFKYAVDKLSNIEGASKEMYALGDAAIKENYVPEAVSMVRTLGSRVRQKSLAAGLPFYKDKVAFAWLGLVSRIGRLGISASNFADIQLSSLLTPLENHTEFLKSFFTDAKNHFYRQADFSTADAILELQQKRYPETVTPPTVTT